MNNKPCPLRFFSLLPAMKNKRNSLVICHISDSFYLPITVRFSHFLFITGMHMSIVASSYRISVLGVNIIGLVN